MSHDNKAVFTAFEGRIGWYRGSEKTIIIDDREPLAYVNLARILDQPKDEWRKIIETALRDMIALATGGAVSINTSPQFVNLSLTPEMGDDISLQNVDDLLDCYALFTSISHKMHHKTFVAEPFPRYDIRKHPSVVRTGVVELRVVENFLRDPERLRRALLNVITSLGDERAMYAKGNPRSWCTSDDFEWNIRKLMTNAGFYVSNNPDAAWRSLVDWSTRYLTAMRKNYLASHTGTYLFCFATQKMLWDIYREGVNYVSHPDVFNIYEQIAGKKILFISPLAAFVAEQYESGRIWRLYNNRNVPRFELVTGAAFISTWPNRPHSDWSETFAQLCGDVDCIAQRYPFEVFSSSCGCYGLPLSNYVREKYKCAVLYVGNIANAYFGVLQNATLEFMKPHQNPDAFVRGDLSKYRNVELIDDGRYV